MIDIVILNLNQEQDTSECILSLRRMNYENFRVILVDNGSNDGSGLRIKERFKEIEFIRSEENLGFAGGCNLAMRKSLADAKADYILLLNSDTVVSENLLSSLLDVADMDKRIGIVGAVNYYYFWPKKIHMAAHRFYWWLGVQTSVLELSGKFKRVQSVSGCCMLIKKEVIEKVGFFDEKFFIYYEDSDLCLRADRAGFLVVAAKEAKVWHKINKTFGTKTPLEYYIYTRNQPLFMLKNCPRIFLLNYFIVYFLKVFGRIIYFFMTSRREISVAIFKGLADFITGNFGKGHLFEPFTF